MSSPDQSPCSLTGSGSAPCKTDAPTPMLTPQTLFWFVSASLALLLSACALGPNTPPALLPPGRKDKGGDATCPILTFWVYKQELVEGGANKRKHRVGKEEEEETLGWEGEGGSGWKESTTEGRTGTRNGDWRRGSSREEGGGEGALRGRRESRAGWRQVEQRVTE